MLGDIAYITEFYVKWKMLANASLQNSYLCCWGQTEQNSAEF